jgi:hypothetical protein
MIIFHHYSQYDYYCYADYKYDYVEMIMKEVIWMIVIMVLVGGAHVDHRDQVPNHHHYDHVDDHPHLYSWALAVMKYSISQKLQRLFSAACGTKKSLWFLQERIFQ